MFVFSLHSHSNQWFSASYFNVAKLWVCDVASFLPAQAVKPKSEHNANVKVKIIYDEDSVITKWTGMGIKGWRLDVADELPTKFIKELRKEVKKNDPESILIGEV